MSIPRVAEAQQQPSAIAVDDACIDVPDQGFTDVSESNVHANMIGCLSAYGITQGTGDGSTYEPGGQVRRWEMALFLVRLLEFAQGSLPEVQEEATFDDVADLTADAQNAIHVLASLDVTRGRTPTTFAPFSFVRRDQMASFINRLQGVIGDPYAEGADYFSDDDGNVHAQNINALAAVGIVQGVGGDRYGPQRSVTRAQMASFLVRQIEQNIDAGNLEAVDFIAGQDFAVTPVDAVTTQVSTGVEDNTGARQYEVEVSDATALDIRLLPAAALTVDSIDRVTFTDADEDGRADVGGDDLAHIEVVNGIAGAYGAHIDGVSSFNGRISFTIDSTQPDDVVPVIWVDADNDDMITVEDGRATELFGVGGRITWVAPKLAIDDAFVQADAGLTGVATYNDAWQLRFTNAVATSTVDGGQFLLHDQDDDVVLVECSLVPEDDDITAATCEIDPAAVGDNNVLSVTLREEPEDRSPAGDGVATYPLTIQSVSPDVVDLDGNGVDLAASADILIDTP